MKTTSPKAKLRKGVAVGSALLVGAALSESAGRITDLLASGPVTLNAGALKTSVEPGNITATVTLPVRVSNDKVGWSKSDAAKFRVLAIKRAARKASFEDNEQFAVLQRQRRANELVSPEEIMSEWHRRRFIGEILTVLDRNVRFFKTEDQARLRSIREAART